MPIDPDQVTQAARELVERYGAGALGMAQERVERASRAGDVAALDLALLVLSAVERQGQAGTSVSESSR
jgi:acyl-CoA hydrolase